MITSSTHSNALILEMTSLFVGIILGTVAAIIAVMLIIFSNTAIGVTPLVNSLNGILPADSHAALVAQIQAMGFPLTGDTPAYWYLARVSALMGYLFIWLSMVWGLLLSTKVVKSRVSPAMTFSTHEFLSLMGLGFAVFHAFVLLGDSYLKFGLADVLLPFHASFKPALVGTGTISLYLYALLVGSFYLRKRIGQKAWRALHYTTFAAFLAVTAHGLLIGTDSTLTIVRVMYLSAASSVLFLVYYRMLTAKKKTHRRSRRPLPTSK